MGRSIHPAPAPRRSTSMLATEMNEIHTLIPKFNSDYDYQIFRNLADDKDKLNDTLDDYENTIVALRMTLDESGSIVHREYIDVADMIKWLSRNNLANIGKNRASYYSNLMKEIIESEGDIGII